MNRLGCIILLAIALVIGAFALMVRPGGGGEVAHSPKLAATAHLERAAAISTGAGGLVIPVGGVQPAQLSDSWGDARGDGTREHHAIDIMAPRGTPVVAAAAGTVEKIFESKNGGHTIYVRRADPAWVDYYAHLDSYAPGLTEGMKVTQGQLIGAVGSTGDASPDGPHLHYEIKAMGSGEGWWQGTDVNPYPILAGKPGRG